jgi:RNA polymerase sigma-70 factor (ECF subfamily)
MNVTSNTKHAAAKASEAQVIFRAQQGDAESFEDLYRLHKRHVYSLCLRMTSNTAKAEEMAQEAFLQLYRKVATFRGESAFSTWLYRLTVNVVLMHMRKKGLIEMSFDEAMEPAQEHGPRMRFKTMDTVLEGSIDRLHLERAIASLPTGCKVIFMLHDIEGYEHHEIAEMLDCSIGNSKSQVHKARMKLRDRLKSGTAEKADDRHQAERVAARPFERSRGLQIQ